MARTMYVSVSDIMRDPDQTTVYNQQTDRRYIVEGCAGSGKSSLALLLLQKILANLGEADEVQTPVYYVTTVHELVECVRQQFSLFDSPPMYNDYAITGGADGMWGRGFISDLQRKNQDPRGNYMINARSCMLNCRETSRGEKTYYNKDIKINKKPLYLLIDEAQDFNNANILDFMNSAQSGCVFYGDDTQSIMGFANPMSLNDIEALLKAKYGKTRADGRVIIYRYTLKRNWRLSKEIAAFAQALPNGVSDPNLLTRCRGEYHEKPVLCPMNGESEMFEYIRARAIKATLDDDVAIILRTNEDVKRFYEALKGMSNVSARYSIEEKRDFETSEEASKCVIYENKKPNVKAKRDKNNSKAVIVEKYSYLENTPVKIMTYENAKGQQFRDVFLVGTNDIQNDPEGLNRFYVGVTRTERFLRIMYSGQLPAFLQNVDPDLYVITD